MSLGVLITDTEVRDKYSSYKPKKDIVARGLPLSEMKVTSPGKLLISAEVQVFWCC